MLMVSYLARTGSNISNIMWPLCIGNTIIIVFTVSSHDRGACMSFNVRMSRTRITNNRQ